MLRTLSSPCSETQDVYEHKATKIPSELLDDAPVIAITLDEQGNLVFCNNYLLQLTGWEREEILSKNWCDLFVPPMQYPAEVYKAQIREGLIPTRYENEILTRHGVRRLIAWCNTMVFDATGKAIATASIGQDVTDSRRVEDALRSSEEKFREMAESIREVIWMMNAAADEIVYVNPAYEQIWGRSCESLYQNPMSWLDAVQPDDRVRTHSQFEKKMRGEQIESEYRIRKPNGEERWISSRAFPIHDHAGQLIRVVGIAQDITERKGMEYKLQCSMDHLRALAGHLQNIREEERARVAREIHDELGQALTAIKIHASFLISDQCAHQQQAQRAESIMQLVDQTIQSVRRISTELRPAILDDLGLVPAIEWYAEEFQTRTGTKCRLELPQLAIVTDRECATAVFRIFQETLTNIARHANATEVGVRLDREHGDLILEVQDNGKGLPIEAGFPSRRSLGFLGMRERALLLGGELVLTGAPGKGTTVKLRIPEVRGEEPRTSAPQQTDSVSSSRPCANSISRCSSPEFNPQ